MNEPKPPPRDIMSDTPRVDAFWESDEMICASTEAWSLVQNFARQLERELAQAQSELRREKHAYDAAVNSHREYVRSIQAAVVDTIGGTVEGQPTHEGNYLQRLRGLMTELTQAQARCAEVEKDAALLRFVRKDNPVTVQMWQEMFDAALKEPR